MHSIPSPFRGLAAAVAGCLVGSAVQAKEPLILKNGDVAVPVVTVESLHPPVGLIVDLAAILRLDRPATTVVIGNPGIADATLSDERTLVMTGKAVGTTNMIVLDERGEQIFDALIQVRARDWTFVRVYDGIQRRSYACEPNCEPAPAVGDEDEYFRSILSQTEAWQEFSGMAGDSP